MEAVVVKTELTHCHNSLRVFLRLNQINELLHVRFLESRLFFRRCWLFFV